MFAIPAFYAKEIQILGLDQTVLEALKQQDLILQYFTKIENNCME